MNHKIGLDFLGSHKSRYFGTQANGACPGMPEAGGAVFSGTYGFPPSRE